MKHLKKFNQMTKDYIFEAKKIIWTKEKCKEEALKYNYRTEFQRGSGSAYSASLKNGWLNDICGHMPEKVKPNGYWTKEKCHEEALKYITKKEFNSVSNSVYSTAQKNGWLNDICSHMTKGERKIYWTKEKCHEEALKYNKRSEFKKNSGGYGAALRKGWLDEICSHMKK